MKTVLLALLLFVGTSTASAECAWVLWRGFQTWDGRVRFEWTRGAAYPTYAKCWAQIRTETGIAEEGSLADWVDWMRGLGRYRTQKPIDKNTGRTLGAFPTEGGAMVFSSIEFSQFQCVPDTVDPRGPKGDR